MLRLDLDEFIFLRLTLLALLIVGIALYLITARRYQSSNSVASSYDQWTEDGIFEFLLGEHIHLGHYGSPPQRKDFLTAKSDLCMKWCVGVV